MQRKRFVKATRTRAPDGAWKWLFAPVELRNGNLYELGAVGSSATEAWRVIDAIEAREQDVLK